MLYGKKAVLVIIIVICFLKAYNQNIFRLSNDKIEVVIDRFGHLTSLKNKITGHNYASGRPLWRLYYDNKISRDNEILAGDNEPKISNDSKKIVLLYETLTYKNQQPGIVLKLTVFIEDDIVRFASEIRNREPHTVVRELQYPLIGNCQILPGQKLLTTYWGGQLYNDPKKQIATYNASYPPYYPPSQKFLQMDQRYPTGWVGGGLASNCFAFVGEKEGLYFGSHDTSFQDTGHGLRLYPSKKFVFDQIDAGFYKYPNCLYGQTWSCDANVVAPYSGDWHKTSTLYRQWVNTWWQHQEEPLWVKNMKGWQRIIMKHQYGEVLFPYTDLSKRIRMVGESVALNTVLVHGWHQGGHDNDYPNYSADTLQGREEALKEQIKGFQNGGGSVLLYYSGRLMDKASDYYLNQGGKKICLRDNTGAEIYDSYKFKGPGTFTGTYNSRSFAIADFRKSEWMRKLKQMADQAVHLGAKSVFFDQMGWGEPADWNLEHEFPIPYLQSITDKARTLQTLRDYIRKKDAELALGIELLTDITAMNVDYVHSRYGATEVLNPDWEQKGSKPISTNFIDWFRYTFPEIIMSDRDIRDDVDIERRVNHTVLKGLRNDVEIYRCRGLIDETPHYQKYLAEINQLKERYKHLLLLGRYTDTEGFEMDNKQIDARRFENNKRAAIVLTQSFLPSATTTLKIPNGYRYSSSGSVGEVLIKPGKSAITITLKKKALTVIEFEKED